SSGWPVGRAFEVQWVDLEEPVPEKDTLRDEAHAEGAARFEREEGIWAGGDRVWFDCTDGGREGLGQVWEYDTRRERLTLIYESPGKRSLSHPDNLVLMPHGGLLLCEDTDPPQYIRGLTRDGGIYDFARAVGYDSEFCGATFGPDGRTLFVNQQGDRSEGTAVTYAIWGPWTE
ncbi:MAG: alkaline phosphatase PhoX, partial [Actinomycetota bacterium]